MCNSRDYKILSARLRHNIDCQIVKCKNCGFVYMNPRPSESDVIEYYGKEYRDNYSQADFNFHLKESKKNAKRRLEYLKEYLRGKGYKKVFDLGCAEGTFLSLMKEEGYECFGMDMDKRYLDYARKEYGLKNIFSGSGHMALKNETFDIISVFHDREQLYRPLSQLKKLRGMLSDNGILYIEVPNLHNFWLYTPWSRNFFLHEYLQAAHFWYFRPKDIKTILKRNGFKIVSLYTGIGELPFPIRNLSEKLKIETFLTKIFYFFPNKLGYGENIIIIAKKNNEK